MENKIVSFDMYYEIHNSFDPFKFLVNYDWCMFDERKRNERAFFYNFTMINDSKDILWHITNQLN